MCGGIVRSGAGRLLHLSHRFVFSSCLEVKFRQGLPDRGILGPERGEFLKLAGGQSAIVLGGGSWSALRARLLPAQSPGRVRQFVVRIRIRRVEARGNFQFAHGRLILSPSPESHPQSAVRHFEFGLQFDGLAKGGFRACRVTARQQVETFVHRLGDPRQKLRGSLSSRLLWRGHKNGGGRAGLQPRRERQLPLLRPLFRERERGDHEVVGERPDGGPKAPPFQDSVASAHEQAGRDHNQSNTTMHTASRFTPYQT